MKKHSRQISRLLTVLLTFSLFGVLAACSSSGSIGNSKTPMPGSTKAVTATIQPGGTTPTATPRQTQPEPATQTDCPIDGGRAAVMRPLALGKDPTIAYIYNVGTNFGQESPHQTSAFAELKRYDIVNGNKTVITHLSNDNITEAQVSTDGQWILFVNETTQYDALQLIRMDGQGLQTLYCSASKAIHGVQWSPDQSQVIFSDIDVSGLYDVQMLNMASGRVQYEVVQLNNASMGYIPRTWADNSRVYLAGVPHNNQQQGGTGIINETGLYLLNTSNGPQPPSKLQTVIPPASTPGCWDFDSDYRTTTLVTSRCNGTFSYDQRYNGLLQGPSFITRGTITGGQLQTSYQNSADAVTQVRFLGYSSSSLLFTINSEYGYVHSPQVDTSHNGVWKMNVGGSGITELFSLSGNNLDMVELNLFSQYPWANVSRNGGALYAVQVRSTGNGNVSPTELEYGSVAGGGLKTFATADEFSGSLAIAGWTTM